MLSSICFMPASCDCPNPCRLLRPAWPRTSATARSRRACGRVVPDEEGLVGLLGIVAVEEVNDLGRDFLIHGSRPSSVSGPSSWQFWFAAVPSEDLHQITGRGGIRQSVVVGIDGAGTSGRARDGSVLARWSDALLGRALVDVGEAHTLHRVEVVEVTPVLLKAMCRR